MSTLPTNITTMLTGLQATHARVQQTHGQPGGQFLRLLKSGQWAYGAEQTEVEPGSHWAIDPASFQAGYIAWNPDPDKAEKLGEYMRGAAEPPLRVEDLPDVGGPWDEQLGMNLMCVTGEDAGVRVTYTTTSKGGVRAVNDMLGEVVRRIQAGHTDECIPLVTLGVDSYQHKIKRYGQIFVPDLQVVGWASLSATPMDEKAKLEAPEPEPEPEPAPPPRRRRRRAVN